MKQSVRGPLGQLLLLTENESNFIFRVKTHAENDGHGTTLAVWFLALYTTYHPSLDME